MSVQGAVPSATDAAFASRVNKTDNLRDKYKLGKTLGSGAFSTVKLAIDKQDGTQYACKVMELPPPGQPANDEDFTREEIFYEIKLLCGLKHANVVFLKEYFEEKDRVYLICELLRGGELLDALIEKGTYTEGDARLCFIQLTKGIQYLHSKHVVHRDIKLENLLLQEPEDISRIKIADFGLAKKSIVSGMQTVCGSPQYVAPEILAAERGHMYGPEVDLWSAGVVLYCILVGYPPFYDENEPMLFRKIKLGQFSFSGAEWEAISDSAKDLIKRLLTTDPKKRITPEQVMEHPWITSSNPNPKNLAQTVENYKVLKAKSCKAPDM
mmetsp:Transcript_47296/g.90280  ORF Transcript_47296/g.90280 Transcript_47296/m.90280 type:complete len:325 (-) Transcript_47296:800-1774(-)|eukprot:CAMPEP_0114248826 /NCGR_PEP_ID=MMETSP0058-20121206/13790_1 /TAXON_ID=36894 /ORGANISM="Pyramimonas parkeae, CCMP726" /LENGTH=324 /DNA_ID=CAMNT_0001362279 /DNA_START=178 /DNA_END=1152 /DNA_ORIENTATION=+